MANYVIIDTCIFRELGFKFYENADYQNIHAFTIATDGEVLLSTIVAAEFENHYRLELKKKEANYKTSINALERDYFLDCTNNDFFDVTQKIESALKLFHEKLHTSPKHEVPISILKSRKIDGLDLAKFIIESKNQGVSNLQVRDYLIWDSILQFAQENSEDRTTKFGRRKVTFEKSIISFITKDNGFTENPLFIELKNKHGVDNIEILNSIPAYLHKKGYNLAFVTPKLLIDKVKPLRILNDLEKDINALLSYVSPKFTDKECDSALAIQKEIQNIELLEYYSYQDSNDGLYKYTVHLKVLVNIVFQTQSVWKSVGEKQYGYLETYDSQNRPVFNSPILFMYGGLLNKEKKTIKSIKLLDFLPWVYIK